MSYPPWIKLLPKVPNTQVVKDKVSKYPYWCKQENPSLRPETATVILGTVGFIRVPFPGYTLWGFPNENLAEHFAKTVKVPRI